MRTAAAAASCCIGGGRSDAAGVGPSACIGPGTWAHSAGCYEHPDSALARTPGGAAILHQGTNRMKRRKKLSEAEALWAGCESPTDPADRSIPACAEEPMEPPADASLREVYPRMCGGTTPGLIA